MEVSAASGIGRETLGLLEEAAGCWAEVGFLCRFADANEPGDRKGPCALLLCLLEVLSDENANTHKQGSGNRLELYF